MQPIIIENKFPKKVFGEIRLQGGLHNFRQVLKTKYLYPIKDYPNGKAVIEIIVPESSSTFTIHNDFLKPIAEINKELAKITFKLANDEQKAILSQQIDFNQKLIDMAKEFKNKPFAKKSFRIIDKDYIISQNLMSCLARLFGFQFYRYKTEIEKEGSDEHLAHAMNVIASTMAEKVQKEFVIGFKEGRQEVVEQNIITRKS